MVDEAQNLPKRSVEELRMLSNYEEGGHALLQSFLLGQSELKNTLQGPGMEQVRQRIIAGYHLRPLDLEELQAYIEHRLHYVGWQSDPAISDDAYARIHEATGGVPRRVNTLVDRILLFGCLEELHSLDAGSVDVVVEEVSNEVGYTRLGSEEEVANKGGIGASVQMLDSGFDARVRTLEQAVETLRSEARRDRKLIKKAILMQMEMDVDDDID